MTEREQRDLARRLSGGSSVFDFETALELVKHKPAKVEELIRKRERTKRNLEELARLRQRRQESLREEFG